jgi:small ligand-binding sensory domain FIST
MKWASSIAISSDYRDNVRQCVDEVARELQEKPDLTIIFVSPHFAREYEQIGVEFYEQLSCSNMIGCSAGGVIGAGKEVEGMPGISLTAGYLPGVKIKPFHLEHGDLPSLDGSPRPWEELFGVQAKDNPDFLILGEPFSLSPEEWLSGLDFAFPGAAKIGGLASAASQPDENVLYLNEEIFHSGLIGVTFSGDLKLDTVVAQGCYPVGDSLQITACENNLLKELDGEPALQRLADVLSDLTPDEQKLAQHSLFVGIVMDIMKVSYEQGDFLIRNLIGADPEEGHLLVAADLHEGQTIQFHLRDAKASATDLDAVLSSFTNKQDKDIYSGALLFSCLGRGQYLYGCSNHDSERFHHFLGQIPLGGFFCNGEIGAVGGTTYLHGYTSSFGMFRSRNA